VTTTLHPPAAFDSFVVVEGMSGRKEREGKAIQETKSFLLRLLADDENTFDERVNSLGSERLSHTYPCPAHTLIEKGLLMDSLDLKLKADARLTYCLLAFNYLTQASSTSEESDRKEVFLCH